MSVVRINQVYGSPDPETWLRVRNVWRDGKRGQDQVTLEGFSCGIRYHSLEEFAKYLSQRGYILIFDPSVSITGEQPTESPAIEKPVSSPSEKCKGDRTTESRYYSVAGGGALWTTANEFWKMPQKSRRPVDWVFIPSDTLVSLIPGMIAARVKHSQTEAHINT